MSVDGPITATGLLLGVWLSAGAALALLALLIVSKAARSMVERWRARRRDAFSPALDALIAGEPQAAARLRPRLWGDADIVEDMLVRTAAAISGDLRDELARAAADLGLTQRRIRQLRSPRIHVRAFAAERLGLLGGEEAAAPLLDALSRERSGARRALIRALGRLRSPRALPALLRLLEYDGELPGAPVAQALLSYGEPAAPYLLRMAEAPCRGRAQALALLGQMKILDAVPILIEAMSEDPNPAVREAAAQAAGRLAHPDALAALRGALRDGAPRVRAQAAWALGRVGDPAAAGELESALDDADWWTRARAAQALARLGEAGLERLRRLADGADAPKRELAAEMLAAAETGR